MYEYIIVTPPPPFIKYKCSLYFGSTYTWLNLIYYSIIFLFTDNNDVVSQTANYDFLGVQAGWPEYRLEQKRLGLATGWAEPRSTANIQL